MTQPRVPLIVVKNPTPEPAPSQENFLPSWATPTPPLILDIISAGGDATGAVNREIMKAAKRRLASPLAPRLTVASTEMNRTSIWIDNKANAAGVMQRLWPSKTGSGGKKRLKTLFSGQWADVPLEEFLAYAKDAGFEGVELACWHFNLQRALVDDAYVAWILELFKKYELQLVAISAHLVGQAVLDNIESRHKGILPEHVWGDGISYGVNLRAAEEMMDTAAVAQRLLVDVVNGFTGSSIWHLFYDFPAAGAQTIQDGYDLLTLRWNPILDVFAFFGEVFALEVHPTEIAFDIHTAERALKALDYRPEFGFNFDPSHLLWQGVDYVQFIQRFPDRIYHVHMKDATVKFGGTGSVLGSYLPFGHPDRGFDFVSLGRGDVNFTKIIRALNDANYNGPLSNEWEDSGMDREEGAREASLFITNVDFSKSDRRMDKAFETVA